MKAWHNTVQNPAQVASSIRRRNVGTATTNSLPYSMDKSTGASPSNTSPLNAVAARVSMLATSVKWAASCVVIGEARGKTREATALRNVARGEAALTATI